MADQSIRLSHSLSEAFCPQQEYLKRVVGLKDSEKYDYAKGHTAEDMAYAFLHNRKAGVDVLSIKEAGLKKMSELQNEMEYEDHKKLVDKFPGILEGVERYCRTVDYETIKTGKWFKLEVLGFTRVIVGQFDIEAKTPCESPLIIDLKFQEKPLEQKKFKDYKQGWVRQLVLYGMAWMVENGTRKPPLLEVHVIVANGDPQVFKVNCTQELMYTVMNNMHDLNLRLDADYWPMNREHNLCSQRWCHVYGHCHQVNALESPLILDRCEFIH